MLSSLEVPLVFVTLDDTWCYLSREIISWHGMTQVFFIFFSASSLFVHQCSMLLTRSFFTLRKLQTRLSPIHEEAEITHYNQHLVSKILFHII